jgi:polar amino acid transport system permease protein
MTILDILQQNREAFLRGLAVTLKLCALVWIIGLGAGTILGVISAQWRRAVGIPMKTVAVVFAGMPVIVLMFWLHYPLQSVLGIVIDPFITATATLACVNVFLVSDLIRGAILNFPTHYVWAGQVCGLSPRGITFHIKFPIILREVLPSLLHTQIVILQSSIFASLISVDEIFRICQQINAEIYKPVEIYSILAILFILVCVPLHGLVYYLKIRFTRDLSER